MRKSKVLLSVLSIVLLLIVGCGGGSGGSSPNTVSGVAAAGAPLDGIVYIKGASGNTAYTFIGPSGTYSFTPAQLSGIDVPYIVYAEGVANGEVTKVYSAGFNLGTINITPITDFVLRTAVAGSADDAYTSWSSSSITSLSLAAAETKIQAQLQPVLNAAGAGTGVNLLTITFEADGTGLDTVLDIIDISFTGNVATVTNNITGSTYTDDVTTTSDDSSAGLPLSDEAGTTATMADAIAMNNVMQILVGLYATSKPSATVINTEWAPHMTDDFLGWGQTKTTQLNGWINFNEGPPVGVELAMSIVSEMSASDLSGTSYTKGYWTRYNYSGPYDTGSFVSGMVYDGTQWLWHGDQRWIDIHIEAVATMNIDSLGAATYSTGLSLDLQDCDSIAAGNGVQSAIVTGVGLPVSGIVMERSGEDFNIFGTFGSHLNMTDGDIATISDNSDYTIRLYSQAASIVSLSDTPLATYTETLTRKPVLNTDLSTSLFPAVTSPTSHTLATANIPGTLTISWTNTSSVYVGSLSLSWSNGGSGYFLENRSIIETDSSATIDSTGNPAPDNNAAHLSIYAKDIYGRRFDIGYEFAN